MDSDPSLPKSTKFIDTKDTPTKGTELQPMTEAQVPYDETLLHNPPVVISIPSFDPYIFHYDLSWQDMAQM